jgi:hypothetical protein
MLERCPEHVTQFVFVPGSHHDQIGNGAQITQIELSVMGGSILTDQTAPVHSEDHGNFLKGHIVDDLVERALEKGGIDGHHRFKTR